MFIQTANLSIWLDSLHPLIILSFSNQKSQMISKTLNATFEIFGLFFRIAIFDHNCLEIDLFF